MWQFKHLKLLLEVLGEDQFFSLKNLSSVNQYIFMIKHTAVEMSAYVYLQLTFSNPRNNTDDVYRPV